MIPDFTGRFRANSPARARSVGMFENLSFSDYSTDVFGITAASPARSAPPPHASPPPSPSGRVPTPRPCPSRVSPSFTGLLPLSHRTIFRPRWLSTIHPSVDHWGTRANDSWCVFFFFGFHPTLNPSRNALCLGQGPLTTPPSLSDDTDLFLTVLLSLFRRAAVSTLSARGWKAMNLRYVLFFPCSVPSRSYPSVDLVGHDRAFPPPPTTLLSHPLAVLPFPSFAALPFHVIGSWLECMCGMFFFAPLDATYLIPPAYPKDQDPRPYNAPGPSPHGHTALSTIAPPSLFFAALSTRPLPRASAAHGPSALQETNHPHHSCLSALVCRLLHHPPPP